jgi:hypothetical protein
MPFKELFKEQVKKEWHVVKRAPLTFIVLFIFALICTGSLMNWIYDKTDQANKTAIAEQRKIFEDFKSVTEQRLAQKDDQLNDYRRRLGLLSTKETASSLLTNHELKQKTLELVSNLRKMLSRCQRDLNSVLASNQSTREVNPREPWVGSKILLDCMMEYNEQSKADAIIVRDELLSRLPTNLPRNTVFLIYEHPTNFFGLENVISDLEQLAKRLAL